MSNLGPQQQNQTFDGLLQVPGGVTVQLQTVQDGDGNNTALKVGSQNVQIGDVVDTSILQIPGGITTSLQTVLDGNGNPTGLQLSSSGTNASTASTFIASNAGAPISGAVPRLISDGFGDYLSVKDFGATGDGVTDDTAAIQAALDACDANGGGAVYVPWPSETYLITATLLIPNHTKLVGLGAVNCKEYADRENDGVQFTYTGADACFALKYGESLTQRARGVAIENIGVSILEDGATGFRLRRCRDVYMLGCSVNMNTDNQIGFHFKGNKDSGAYGGVFDCNFFRLSSYGQAAYTGCIHYKLEGDDSSGTSGRCNANYFYGIRAGRCGVGLEIGPSVNNAFFGVEFEVLTDDYIRCLSGASYNTIYSAYLGDLPVGWSSKVFNCEAGSSYNVLQDYNTGGANEQDVVLQSTNRAQWITGSQFVPTTTSRVLTARLEGAAFGLMELRASGLYMGPGLASPVSVFPAQTVVQTNYSSALSTLTPDVFEGRIQSIRFESGATGTLTINGPENANRGETVYFHIDNESGVSINLIWTPADYISPTNLPTSIANNTRISLVVQRVAVANEWTLTGDYRVLT